MKITNTVLLQTLRGDILQFIYGVAPTKVKGSTITEAYCEYYKYKDILRAIVYLTDKNYLEKIDVASPINPQIKSSFYTITADGMCIVEGTRSDIGIKVEREVE